MFNYSNPIYVKFQKVSIWLISFYQDGDYWELPSEEEGGEEKDEERGGRGGAYFEENIDFDDLVRKK